MCPKHAFSQSSSNETKHAKIHTNLSTCFGIITENVYSCLSVIK